MRAEILSLRDVSLSFGGLKALTNVSINIARGEIVGLIGPNGAGKTTLVNVIAGVYKPTRGQIHFEGKRIDGLKDFRVSRIGIARTFQIVQPFPKMSVLDNVAVAAMYAAGVKSVTASREVAREHLAFCMLDRYIDAPASSLSLAHRKRLELAKSLAMNPRLLMLDEVNAGLNSGEMEDALSIIKGLASRGITIILIEHLMKVVMNTSSRILVLKSGELIADGRPRDVIQDPKVVEAYLGERYAKEWSNIHA